LNIASRLPQKYDWSYVYEIYLKRIHKRGKKRRKLTASTLLFSDGSFIHTQRLLNVFMRRCVRRSIDLSRLIAT